MDFPLSIVSDYLVDRGFSVVKEPANLRATFSWVSADTDLAFAEDADDQEDMLYVLSTYRDADGFGPAILVSAGAAASDRDDVFLISGSQEPPSAIAHHLQIFLLGIYRWIESMHHALAEHCSCQELLELSEPILKNFVSINDSIFAYIAHTPNIAPIEEASRYFVEHKRYSNEVIQAVRDSNLNELWSHNATVNVFESNAINPMPSIDHVYHLNSQYAAHLVMVCPQKVTLGQEFLFSLLIGPVGTALSNLWRLHNPFKQRYTQFFANLIREDQGNRKSTREQAKTLGIPVEGIFKVLAVADAWKGSSEQYFAGRAISLLPECKVLLVDSMLVILVSEAKGAWAGYMANVEKKVFELVGSLETTVGVSRKFFSLFDIADALAEARIALRYGKIHCKDFLAPGERAEHNAATYIFRFKRYFPYFAVDPDAGIGGLSRCRTVAAQVIGPIERDDERYGTSDTRILRTYLRCDCRINETGKVLGMHRNSVAYRLRHIERTYDLELDDADEKLFLGTLLLMPRR